MTKKNDPVLIRDLAINVFATNGRLVDAGNVLVRDVGLTTAWWQVLGALGYSPVPLPVAHIARNMGLTRQAVQRIVELLVERGFVSMESNPHHQRAKLVVLTQEGRAALTTAELSVRSFDQIAIEQIGADRVAVAIEVLHELREALAQVLDVPGADLRTEDSQRKDQK